MKRLKQVVTAPSGKIDALRGRLQDLMDRLAVDPEVRAGVYSNSSVVADLFDALTSRDEIAQRLTAAGMADISPSTPLVTVLSRIVSS